MGEELTKEKIEELRKWHEYKLKQAENNVAFHKEELKKIKEKQKIEEPKVESVEVDPYAGIID